MLVTNVKSYNLNKSHVTWQASCMNRYTLHRRVPDEEDVSYLFPALKS
jgi:hypothetical protein